MTAFKVRDPRAAVVLPESDDCSIHTTSLAAVPAWATGATRTREAAPPRIVSETRWSSSVADREEHLLARGLRLEWLDYRVDLVAEKTRVVIGRSPPDTVVSPREHLSYAKADGSSDGPKGEHRGSTTPRCHWRFGSMLTVIRRWRSS